ncbi:hypothetical protein HanPSC8_Chr05g0203321 [Helianthus annuus]|nr:hypothetical protein HanPSC8_Chr05g0203321 [Helianthus annuus]
MAGYHSEYPPYVWEFVESCQVFAQITSTAQDEGDPRFPKMLAILERMFETLGQMLRESVNQHVDPECEGCAGPHRYEDCPVAFRWSIPSVTQGIYWDDDWDWNRGMNDESVEATELTNMKTPLWDAEGTCEDNEVEIEEEEEEVVEIKEVEEELPNNLQLFDIGLETTTDDSVPPPVQQDVTLNWYSTPWYYGPELTDDDFWNDDEGEDMDEPLSKMENERGMHIPSWEDEFGDELVGLPTLEDEEFDPVGDLAYLETLLVETPTMEIKYAPNVEEEIVAEEFDSRPVENPDDGRPPRSRTRERARKSLDQHLLRIQGWYRRKKKEESLKFAQHHPSHYMPRIRFGPGKFKYWWSDPFENFKRFINSILKILINNKERVELNGLDRGWIKEKPPDRV